MGCGSGCGEGVGESTDGGFQQSYAELTPWVGPQCPPPPIFPRDGIPIYGLSKDGAGAQLTSCYRLVDGADTEEVKGWENNQIVEMKSLSNLICYC